MHLNLGKNRNNFLRSPPFVTLVFLSLLASLAIDCSLQYTTTTFTIMSLSRQREMV